MWKEDSASPWQKKDSKSAASSREDKKRANIHSTERKPLERAAKRSGDTAWEYFDALDFVAGISLWTFSMTCTAFRQRTCAHLPYVTGMHVTCTCSKRLISRWRVTAATCASWWTIVALITSTTCSWQTSSYDFSYWTGLRWFSHPIREPSTVWSAFIIDGW